MNNNIDLNKDIPLLMSMNTIDVLENLIISGRDPVDVYKENIIRSIKDLEETNDDRYNKLINHLSLKLSNLLEMNSRIYSTDTPLILDYKDNSVIYNNNVEDYYKYRNKDEKNKK